MTPNQDKGKNKVPTIYCEDCESGEASTGKVSLEAQFREAHKGHKIIYLNESR